MKINKRTAAMGAAWSTMLAAMGMSVAISQTAPGTLANPIKGGGQFLQFSRGISDGVMSQGKLTYYQCGTQETQLVLGRHVTGTLVSVGCDEMPELKGLSISGLWNQWVRVTAGSNGSKYQGLHKATLNLMDASGLLIATLQCQGSVGVGTARAPLTANDNCETCAFPDHFEGSFTGSIVSGADKGTYLWGSYSGDFGVDPVAPNEASWPFKMAIDGVDLKFCPSKFAAAGVPNGSDLKVPFAIK